MIQQMEYRGVAFQYTQEYEQDLLALFGTQARALAEATIDHLLDRGEDLKEVKITTRKTDQGLEIHCGRPKDGDSAASTTEDLK